MIAVDTNVIAYLYLPGQFTEAAERLLRRDAAWNAPVLWRSELRNILAGYLRRADLEFEHAYAIQREAESLLAGAEHEPDSRRVMELVKASDCCAYDCEFVAVAEDLGTRLVTMHGKLLKAFPRIAKSLTDIGR